jgi:hypothetical protein
VKVDPAAVIADCRGAGIVKDWCSLEVSNEDGGSNQVDPEALFV